MFRAAFNPNLNLWPWRSRNIGLALLRYCVIVQERLESYRDFDPGDGTKMEDALEQALSALDLLNDGHKYDEHNPSDPLKQAEESIKPFVPRNEWTRPTDDYDKNKLATATKMIRELTDSATPAPTRYSVDVKLCDCSMGTVNPISVKLECKRKQTF
ncbi:hypothetical protein FRC01_013814 [Tulasnella sp. 417]|nr:hypothetical protein FRC01_013814 [Tulasnella sp. 417]